MLIIHRMIEIGAVSQTRPKIWQSDEPPQDQKTYKTHQHGDIKLYVAVGTHKLDDTIQAYSKTASTHVGVGIRDHKLVSYSLDLNYYADVKTTLKVGAHKLRSVVVSTPIIKSGAKISLDIDSQRLYSWGVYAEVLDEDNLGVVFGLGNHKLYEEIN